MKKIYVLKRLGPSKDRIRAVRIFTSFFGELVTKGEEDTNRMAHLIMYSVRDSPIPIYADEIGLEY